MSRPVAVRPSPRATLVSRCGRARCPHRAAAPLPVADRHRGAWLRTSPPRRTPTPLRAPPAPRHCPWRIATAGNGAAWQVAHAESFACHGSVRDTVRGRAAHPARCHDRAAIPPAHYPCGAMGTSRPTAITPAKFAFFPRSPAPPRGAPFYHSCPRRAHRPTARAPFPCGLLTRKRNQMASFFQRTMIEKPRGFFRTSIDPQFSSDAARLFTATVKPTFSLISAVV